PQRQTGPAPNRKARKTATDPTPTATHTSRQRSDANVPQQEAPPPNRHRPPIRPGTPCSGVSAQTTASEPDREHPSVTSRMRALKPVQTLNCYAPRSLRGPGGGSPPPLQPRGSTRDTAGMRFLPADALVLPFPCTVRFSGRLPAMVVDALCAEV